MWLPQRSYFSGRLQEGFIALFIAKDLLRGSALALLGLFFPIFLYVVTGNDFQSVTIFFLLTHALYVLLLPFGAKFLQYFGFRAALVISGFLSAAFYGTLFFTNEYNIFLLIPGLLLLLPLFRLFFWIPYHVDFTKFTEEKNRGREVSSVLATVSFLGVVGPILAGYIIQTTGFPTLFGISVVLILLGTFAYLLVPRTNEKYEWTYMQTWNKLFSKEQRPAIIGLAASGAESAVAIVIWPIFIYEVLQGNIFQVGALSTFVIGASIVIQLLLGKYIDNRKSRKKHTLQVGSVLYALGWILKMFILSGAQIFVIGLYHNIAKVFTQTSFDTLVYDLSADQGHYIDEFTVLREMAIHIGKGVAMIFASAVALFAGLQWAFVLAAVASLAFNAVHMHQTKREELFLAQ